MYVDYYARAIHRRCIVIVETPLATGTPHSTASDHIIHAEGLLLLIAWATPPMGCNRNEGRGNRSPIHRNMHGGPFITIPPRLYSVPY